MEILLEFISIYGQSCLVPCDAAVNGARGILIRQIHSRNMLKNNIILFRYFGPFEGIKNKSCDNSGETYFSSTFQPLLTPRKEQVGE